jgi:hypothetical protein
MIKYLLDSELQKRVKITENGYIIFPITGETL